MNIKFANEPIFQIVGNGMMASENIAEGRLIPAIIIDFRNVQRYKDLFLAHSESGPGDVESTWARKLIERKTVLLSVKIRKPMLLDFFIEFHLREHYGLIDGIIRSKGVYIIDGQKGDRVSNTIEGGILLEIPRCGFEESWDNLLNKTLVDIFLKAKLSKKNSKAAARENMAEMKKVWNFRKTK